MACTDPNRDRVKHGTRSCFVNRKCRRLSCRSANATYQARRIASVRAGEWKGLPATDYRTLRKLKRMGFTKAELAKRFGITSLRIKSRMRPSSLKRILDLHERISIE